MARLVDRYMGRVYGLCWRMLGQRQDAEDTAQETFLRALGSLHRWDSARPFEPWLMAIAGNRCRTLLAKRARRMKPSQFVEDLADRSTEYQAAEHLAEEIRLAVKHLRAEYRQAFQLFHEHQLCYEEIAAALDCPLGTIKTWVHRARREIVATLRKRGVFAEVEHAVRPA